MSGNRGKRQRVQEAQEEEVRETDVAEFSAKQKAAIQEHMDWLTPFLRQLTGVDMADFVVDEKYNPQEGESPHTITFTYIHLRSVAENILNYLRYKGFADVTVECKTEDLAVNEYLDEGESFDLFSVSAKKDVYTITVRVQPSMDQFPLLAAALNKGQGNVVNE